MSLQQINSEELKEGIPEEVFRGREYYCSLCSDSGRQEIREYTGNKEFKIKAEILRKTSSFHANHWDYLFNQIALQDFLKNIPTIKTEEGFTIDEGKASEIQIEIFRKLKENPQDYLPELLQNIFIGEKRHKELEYIWRNSENWMTYSSQYKRKLQYCNCKRGTALSLANPPKQLEDKRK